MKHYVQRIRTIITKYNGIIQKILPRARRLRALLCLRSHVTLVPLLESAPLSVLFIFLKCKRIELNFLLSSNYTKVKQRKVSVKLNFHFLFFLFQSSGNKFWSPAAVRI